MLRESAERTTVQESPLFDRRKFLQQAIAGIALTINGITRVTDAQAPAQQSTGQKNLDSREEENSYASIEAWLEKSPIAVRAKKALSTLHDLDNDEPRKRDQVTTDIIESLRAVQKEMLPIPEEFMQPLRTLHRTARENRNTDVFFRCERIIMTLEIDEIDAPSTIPSHISYQPEAFKDALSKHLGLTIDGLTEELSAKIIRQLSKNTRTPGRILSIIIQEDFFIEIVPNGGNVHIRRRVSSDDRQRAYDSGSICIITSLDIIDNYRGTDCMRPKKRGPLLTMNPTKNQENSISTFLHRVDDSVTASSKYRKNKHSVTLPRSKDYVKKVPGEDLPHTGAHIEYCGCMENTDTPQPIEFVHAVAPMQLPLTPGIQQTSLLSIHVQNIDGTLIIRMTPKVHHESDIVSHSTVCSLAGWSAFSINGKELPATMSMKSDAIVWEIQGQGDNPVTLSTYGGLNISTANLPSHP